MPRKAKVRASPCPACGSKLMQTGNDLNKAGQIKRYYRCANDSCGGRWNILEGEMFESGNKFGILPKKVIERKGAPHRPVDELIPGARVYYDGKFSHVAK